MFFCQTFLTRKTIENTIILNFLQIFYTKYVILSDKLGRDGTNERETGHF